MTDGKTCDTVDTVLVELRTDTGVSGYGKVCPIPHYLPAEAAAQRLRSVRLRDAPRGAGRAAA